MLSCKESARLMSQEMDRPLGFRERLSLRLHLLACYGCRNAQRQLAFIRQACQSWLGRDD